jgi:hypothetical protein
MRPKKWGKALACMSISPKDLDTLAGMGVVGGGQCIDMEVGVGGEDMQSGVDDQRNEVYSVGVEQSRSGEHERGILLESAQMISSFPTDVRCMCGKCFGHIPSHSCMCSPGMAICDSLPSLALVVHSQLVSTDHRRHKRFLPTLALAPNRHTAQSTGSDMPSSGPRGTQQNFLLNSHSDTNAFCLYKLGYHNCLPE